MFKSNIVTFLMGFFVVLGASSALPNHSSSHAEKREDDGQVLWKDGCPSIDDIVSSPMILKPDYAAILYAIVKCGTRWEVNLLNTKVNPGPVDTKSCHQGIVGHDLKWLALFDSNYTRFLQPFVPLPEKFDKKAAGWPMIVQTTLEGMNNGADSSVADLLRRLTGLPTMAYKGSQYDVGSLSFAIERADETPIILKAKQKTTHLVSGATYAVKEAPPKGSDKVTLWQAPTEPKKDDKPGITYGDLLNDLDELVSFADFTRFAASAFYPCVKKDGKWNCDIWGVQGST